MTQLEKDLWRIFSVVLMALLTAVFAMIFVFELLIAIQFEFITKWAMEAFVVGAVMCFLWLLFSRLTPLRRDTAEKGTDWVLVLRRVSLVFFAIAFTGIFFEEVRPVAAWVNVLASACSACIVADICIFDKRTRTCMSTPADEESS